MAHLKRYSIPVYWRLGKKEDKFTTAPTAGPHPRDKCIPLLVVLRNVLKLSETSKEARKIIKSGEILVDKKPKKDPNYPLGLMDVIEIPKMKKIYRVGVDKKGLVLAEEDAKNADRKLCKIKGKKTIKGGMTQLNLHDGRNILVEKDVYKTSDSLLIELPTQKILKHFNFAKNSPAIVVSGKNMGVQGKIKDISERKTMTETSSVIIETKGGEIETVKNYVIVGEVK